MDSPIVSEDGLWLWTGTEWVPNQPPPTQPPIYADEYYLRAAGHQTQGGFWDVPTVNNSEVPKPDVTIATANLTDGQSVDNEVDFIAISTIVGASTNAIWIALAGYAVFLISEPVYDQIIVDRLWKSAGFFYLTAVISTLWAKFLIENEPEVSNGYLFLNSASIKGLLIPFAIIALIIFIGVLLLKFFLQIMFESMKQGSYNNQKTQMKRCMKCGTVKQGPFARCCGIMRKI